MINPLVVPFGGGDIDEINAALAEGRTVVYYDDSVLDENLQALDRWTFPEGWVQLGRIIEGSDFDYYEYEENK